MIDEKKLIEALEKYHNGWKPSYITKLIESVFLDIKDIVNEQPKVGEWIPCSERLPETDENRKYLVCGEKGGIYIAEFVCNTIYGKPLGISWWTARGRHSPNPIAWMPLPEPYKE